MITGITAFITLDMVNASWYVLTAISNLSCTSQILVKFPFINLSTIMIQGSCLTYFLCTDYFAKQFSKQLRYDRSTQYSNSVAKEWFQSKGNKLKEELNGLIFLKPHLISKFIKRHEFRDAKIPGSFQSFTPGIFWKFQSRDFLIPG